jgi:hypothetical protein
MSTYVVFEHASQRAHRAVAQSEHACVAVRPASVPPPPSPLPGLAESAPPPSSEPGAFEEEPPQATSAHAKNGKPKARMVFMVLTFATRMPQEIAADLCVSP